MSIKKKLTILFAISLIVMVTLSIWIDRLNRQNNQKIVVSKYINVTKELIPYIVDLDLNRLNKKLKELNLQKVDKKSGSLIFKKDFTFGNLEIFKDKKYYYLKISYLDDNYIFFDKSQITYYKETLITDLLLFIDIFLLIVIYLITLKIFKPLDILISKLKAFSKGNLDVQMPKGKDLEIKVLSNSFNNMAKELKSALNDRENLLRYIGHEIKTPLAKAKFAIENRDLNQLKCDIKDIEKFVEEILNMHLITSKNLDIKEFKAQTLIIEALNKLLIEDEEKIKIEIKDFSIKGDLDYLTIALKNLIDNALKYASSLPITIVAKDNYIEVISKGDKLEKPFSYYTQAFTKESSKGHGLGLNLVQLIANKHNFKLEYKYLNKNNIFILKFTKS